jgi:hypothetical protein
MEKFYLCLLKHMRLKRIGDCRYSSIILNLCTRRRFVISPALRPLYPQGNNYHYPLDRRLGRFQSWSERCEKYILLLSGIKPRFLGRPARSLIAILICPAFLARFEEHGRSRYYEARTERVFVFFSKVKGD